MKSALLFCITSVLLLSFAACGLAATEVVLAKGDPTARIACMNPVWSPDGRSIAYVKIPYSERPGEPTILTSGKSLWIASLAGSSWKHRKLADDADWPVWSPDSKQIAVHQNGLAVINVATGKAKILVPDKGPVGEPGSELHYPLSWSPGGRYIHFETALYEGSRGGVYDVNAGKKANVTVGTEGVWISPAKLLSFAQAESDDPSQSFGRITDLTSGSYSTVLKNQAAMRPYAAQGSSSAWVWVTENAPKGEGIYRLDTKQGTLAKQVGVRASELYWPRDGKQFAFLAKFAMKAGEEAKTFLYVGNTKNWAFKIAAKGALTPGDSWHDRMKYASWSPNGTSIAFVTDTGDIRIVKL